jgi:hypothetical protein
VNQTKDTKQRQEQEMIQTRIRLRQEKDQQRYAWPFMSTAQFKETTYVRTTTQR